MQRDLTIHGHVLRFFIDSTAAQASADLDARMRRNEAALSLLPVEHIRMIVEPIIIVEQFPGSRRRGGGWFPPAGSPGRATVSAWLGANGAANTRVAPTEITRRVGGGAAGSGIIGITSYSFLLDTDWGFGHHAHEYTVLHEVGHSVDFHSSLIPPASLPSRSGNAPYQGQRYEGGAIGELAAEAYSRFFLRPSSMCRGGQGTPRCEQPSGVYPNNRCPTQIRCSGRMQRDLQATAAFALAHVTFPLASAERVDDDEQARRAYASRFGAKRGITSGPSEANELAWLNRRAEWRRPGSLGGGFT